MSYSYQPLESPMNPRTEKASTKAPRATQMLPPSSTATTTAMMSETNTRANIRRPYTRHSLLGNTPATICLVQHGGSDKWR